MDLGTAKPTAEERRKVPHHLVDIVDPDYRFSAGDYKRRALNAISEITARGKVPVLVGGTGLYFRALEYNLSDAPPANQEFRRKLYLREEAETGTLHRKLAEIDPEAAEALHPNDLVRVVRALELFHCGGVRFSEFTRMEKPQLVRPVKIGVTLDRGLLYRRLEERCREMLELGLGRETAGLVARGYDERLASMKGLGYSHYIQFFKGCLSLAETHRLFMRDTRRYAKRQLTWFGREQDVVWTGPGQYKQVREILHTVRRELL
jgi:tRNA dimethylallyltransferase